MQNDIDNKPLTIKDIGEVLVPAMQEVFVTKKDLQAMQEVFVTKHDLQELKAELIEEIQEKFDKIMTSSDRIIKDLEILMTEKAVGYHQRKKRAAVMVNSS